VAADSLSEVIVRPGEVWRDLLAPVVEVFKAVEPHLDLDVLKLPRL
jgi:hypothetical protein